MAKEDLNLRRLLAKHDEQRAATTAWNFINWGLKIKYQVAKLTTSKEKKKVAVNRIDELSELRSLRQNTSRADSKYTQVRIQTRPAQAPMHT